MLDRTSRYSLILVLQANLPNCCGKKQVYKICNLDLGHINFEDAIDIIVGFYRNYHSSTYDFDRLVIRLRNPVSDELLDRLNRDFADILTRGKIEKIDGESREGTGSETEGLWRLGLCFDRRSIGRLRRMVDVINDGDAEAEDGSEKPRKASAAD